MTAAGYTGLEITPNAHLLGWGRFEGTYDRQLPGVVANPQGHNFVAGFGLLPNLEISGRLAASTIHNSCFTGCGAIRDLSASAKAAIAIDPSRKWWVGAGFTDAGGAATHFRSYYGVVTFGQGPFEASAGLAKKAAPRTATTARSPLDGPFAAAAWSPMPWLRGQIEYSDRNAWAGVRLFAPKAFLPEGWNAYVGLNHRLTQTALTQRSWVTAGISIPLYTVPKLPASSRTRDEVPAPVSPLSTAVAIAGPPPPAAQPAQLEVPPAAAPTDQQLESLGAALQAKGLEDIWVGRMPDGSVAVRANNAAYSWNSLDALGAALGAVARELAPSRTAYRFVLTQRQVPLVAVIGQADCLKDWIESVAQQCTAGQLSTPASAPIETMHEQVAWQVTNLQPSWKTLRVHLTPLLRTQEATELGVLDYSAGLNIGLEQPLWRGASFEWRRNVPLANSSDFDYGGAFGFRRVRSETERIAITQTVRLPLDAWLSAGDDVKARKWGLGAVYAQATAGRVGSYYDGAVGSVRWEPGEGLHRLTAIAGRFRNKDFGAYDAPGPRFAVPLLASYRYSVAPTRTYVEATAGQFFNNDRGIQLGLRQWFNDVTVGVYYRRTKSPGVASRQWAGIEITLPIGPRRDPMPLWNVQITGTPRFGHFVESTIRERINVVAPGAGALPPVPSIEQTFNSDRSGLSYFEDNMHRIRDAAQ